MTSGDFPAEALQAVRSAGLLVDNLAWDTSTIQRVSTVAKPRSKNGAYRAFSDPPRSIWWKNFESGQSGTLSEKSERSLSLEERSRNAARYAEIHKQRQEEEEQRHLEAAGKAQEIYSKAAKCEAHPYLTAKGVQVAPGLRVDQSGNLVVPAYSEQRKISTIQTINNDGQKRFLYGGRKAGCFFPIGAKDASNEDPLVICEGLATGLSIREFTGFSIFVAFDAGGLKSVAQVVRRLYPDREVIIAADNDASTAGNPGLVKATEAAKEVGGRIAIPRSDGEAVDWNDIHQSCGAERAKELFVASIAEGLLDDVGDGEILEKLLPKLPAIAPRSAYELLMAEIPEPDAIVEGILPTQCVCLVGGLEKTGKTFFLIQMALALVTGTPFLGHEVRGKHRVMFLSPEGTDLHLKKRLNDSIPYIQGLDDADLKDRLFCASTLGAVKLDDGKGPGIIRGWTEQVGADVLILDSVYRFMSRGNENDHADARTFQDTLDGFKASGLTIICSHHLRKPTDSDKGIAEVRGAGWTQYCDTILRLSKGKSGGKYSLNYFLRHFEEPEPLVLKRQGPLFSLPSPEEWNVRSEDVRNVVQSHGGRIEGKEALSRLIQEECPDASRRDIHQAILVAEQRQEIQSCRMGGLLGNKRAYVIPSDGER